MTIEYNKTLLLVEFLLDWTYEGKKFISVHVRLSMKSRRRQFVAHFLGTVFREVR